MREFERDCDFEEISESDYAVLVTNIDTNP